MISTSACVHGAGGVRLHPESDPDGEEERRRRQKAAQQERQGRRGRQSGNSGSGFPGEMHLNFEDGFPSFQSTEMQFLSFLLSFFLSSSPEGTILLLRTASTGSESEVADRHPSNRHLKTRFVLTLLNFLNHGTTSLNPKHYIECIKKSIS